MAMKITQVITVKDPRYPYRYRVDVPNDLVLHEALFDWINSTGFRCCVVGNGVYVPDEKDAVFFALKWAQ